MVCADEQGGVCVRLLSTKAILGLLVVSTFHFEELHLAQMCVLE